MVLQESKTHPKGKGGGGGGGGVEESAPRDEVYLMCVRALFCLTWSYLTHLNVSPWEWCILYIQCFSKVKHSTSTDLKLKQRFLPRSLFCLREGSVNIRRGFLASVEKRSTSSVRFLLPRQKSSPVIFSPWKSFFLLHRRGCRDSKRLCRQELRAVPAAHSHHSGEGGQRAGNSPLGAEGKASE